nr:chromosome segregation protein SMC [Salsipaludibacter albus]
MNSLKMRGFKSFADATELEVEPGITVIVGPNGSGKSNVVDALSWVLGTAAPSRVRGGTMTDVVFAGSPDRRGANQARVEITIDNSDGVLGTQAVGTSRSAQEFTEVTVAREIDLDGSGTYKINGEVVRALDVQELLSDTGLGRELHTIVGQGQLDEILNARPEDRRSYIEEAAGILKHRRRRERSVRKLEQVDEHIHQLSLVLRELRRQLRPLQRQAEQADRHASLQADLRGVRLELAAHDLARLTRERAAQADTDDATRAREEAAAERVAGLRSSVDELEAELATRGPEAEAAQEVHHRLTSLGERLRGTAELVAARRRHLADWVEEPLAGRPPDELRAAADRADASRADREEALADLHRRLDDATQQRRDVEAARRDHERERAAAVRARARARERHVRWEAQVAALAGGIQAAEAEFGRARDQLEGIDERREEVDAEVTGLADHQEALDAAVIEAEQSAAAAALAVEEAQQAVDDLATRERELERSRSAHEARAEALRAALREAGGGADVLLETGMDDGLELLGQVADHVRVADEHGRAVAAVLGTLGEAVVAVPQPGHGGATVLAARPGGASTALDPTTDGPSAAACEDAGARWLADLVVPVGDAGDAVTAALATALADAVLVRDWGTAVELHGRAPELTVVTPDGMVASPRGWRATGDDATSAVVAATQADQAEERARALAIELDELAVEVRTARTALEQRRAEHDRATDERHRVVAEAEGSRQRLARLSDEAEAIARQRGVVASHRSEIDAGLRHDRDALAELRTAGPPQVDELAEEDPEADERGTELDEQVGVVRERELDARVDVERATEQVRTLAEQADELRREAVEVEAALAEAARRRERRREGIARCAALATVCAAAREELDRSLAEAADHRDTLRSVVAERRRELAGAREQLDEADRSLADVRERRHEADMVRADLDHRIEALADRVRTEFQLDVRELAAEQPDAEDADRDALVEREDDLVRKVGLLGQINPLALEEFQALEQRHAFLAEQVADLRESRRDLTNVIDAVDDRIREVFTDAWEDVSAAFERIFAVMFPGGHGRLRLVGDDDPLTAGVEVEARPPGKKVSRLSLLSGGERSLTVLAFVFAIFMARPSPFYVLDEVDAALDDVNLQRLLEVIESFRGSSQVIMVTHQKRSMEIADVLYGITMGADAVTKVVAQRLDELEASGVLEAAG